MARIELAIVVVSTIYCSGCGLRWKGLEMKDGHVFCPLCEVEIPYGTL